MTRRSSSSPNRLGSSMLRLYLLAAFALAAFSLLVMLPAGRVDPVPAGISSEPGFVEADADETRPDHPNEADAFRQLSLQDETGQIPPDALLQAVEHVKQMEAAQQTDRPGILGILRPEYLGQLL